MHRSVHLRPAITAAAVLTLAGCALLPPAAPAEPSRPPQPAPAFEGAFAVEYLEVWNETDSDFVRSVIEDGRISEEEWSETANRLSSCLAKQGVEFLGFDEEGGYSVNPGNADGGTANVILGDCEKSSGEYLVGYLRTLAIINPANQDIDEITAACMIREGLVDASYTVEQYRDEAPGANFSFIDPVHGPEGFATCAYDPLGLLPEG